MEKKDDHRKTYIQKSSYIDARPVIRSRPKRRYFVIIVYGIMAGGRFSQKDAALHLRIIIVLHVSW